MTISERIGRPVSHDDPYKRLPVLQDMVRADIEGQEAASELTHELEVLRPRVRADCVAGGINEQRPCPWYGCKYHLGLDVNPTSGSMQVRDIDKMVHTCALDVAEVGGVTLEEIAEITNLTRERIRQVEVRGLIELKSIANRNGISPEGWERPDPIRKSSIVSGDDDE
jgi:hypothetical protein